MLKISLRIDYERAQAASGEQDPLFLATYLDGYFDRTVTMHTVGASSASSPSSLQVAVVGKPHQPPKEGILTLPADACIGIQAFTTVANPEGILCRQEAGVCTILLTQLWQAHNTSKPIQMPLRIHTLQNHLIRGMATVHVLHMQADTDTIPVSANLSSVALVNQDPIEHPYAPTILKAVQQGPQRVTSKPVTALKLAFGPVEPYMNMEQNLQYINGQLEAYLESFIEEQKQYVIVHTGTERIECPLNPGQVTVANTQMQTPFASYVLHERPAISSLWWQKQWQILARRRNFKDGRALAEWLDKEASIGEQAAMGLTWCTQFIETLPYISDMIGNREPIEMFGEALVMLSGDCEDGSSAILMIRDAMRHANTGDIVRKAKSDVETKIQSKLQHISRQYVDMLCIDGVTASHVGTDYNNNTNGSRVECTAAHAAIHALPRDYMAACIQRWRNDSPLVALLKVDSEFKDQLPVLVGEGTGVIDTGIESDPLGPLRERLYSQPVIAGLKKQMFGEPGQESEFYKVMLFGATNLFFDSHRTATFNFTRIGAALPGHVLPQSPQKYAKGVHYEHLMQRDASIALIPYGDGNKNEFTPEQARIVRSVAKNRIPPPPLVATEELTAINPTYAKSQTTIRNTIKEQMDAWCTRVNNGLYGRHGSAVPVNIFPYVESIGPEFLDQLYKVARQDRQLVHVDYNLEEHHPCLQTVRIGFFYKLSTSS